VYEVNSETDFVARNDDFVEFIAKLGTVLLAKKPGDITAAKDLTSDTFNGLSVDARVLELVGKIGENIAFRRYQILNVSGTCEKIFSYIHGDGRIGILLKLSCEKADAVSAQEFADLGKDLAMQIAAANPLGISREAIIKDHAALIEKEKEIYFTQAQTSGKPEKVWPKIVEGKVDKFFKESALLDQAFIREPERSVTDRIKDTEKTIGSAVTVVSFIRFELGAE
jgi:elongation factor Ts